MEEISTSLVPLYGTLCLTSSIAVVLSIVGVVYLKNFVASMDMLYTVPIIALIAFVLPLLYSILFLVFRFRQRTIPHLLSTLINFILGLFAIALGIALTPRVKAGSQNWPCQFSATLPRSDEDSQRCVDQNLHYLYLTKMIIGFGIATGILQFGIAALSFREHREHRKTRLYGRRMLGSVGS
jgi:hypothetical protein